MASVANNYVMLLLNNCWNFNGEYLKKKADECPSE